MLDPASTVKLTHSLKKKAYNLFDIEAGNGLKYIC